MRHSPSEISTINTVISQKTVIISREDSVVFLLNSYLCLNLDVLQATTGNKYANDIDFSLVNSVPIALLSSYKLLTSSGKHLEEISRAHIVCLMDKLITNAKGPDDLFTGFDRDLGRNQRELIEKKPWEENIMLQ